MTYDVIKSAGMTYDGITCDIISYNVITNHVITYDVMTYMQPLKTSIELILVCCSTQYLESIGIQKYRHNDI